MKQQNTRRRRNENMEIKLQQGNRGDKMSPDADTGKKNDLIKLHGNMILV